jgi:hypothetical protein
MAVASAAVHIPQLRHHHLHRKLRHTDFGQSVPRTNLVFLTFLIPTSGGNKSPEEVSGRID